MKSVLIGTLLMIVISAAAWMVLDMQQISASDAFTSKNNAVRLD